MPTFRARDVPDERRPVTTFRVWAPRADRVAVEIDDGRIAMERRGGGWWEVSWRAEPGKDYRFVLDGGDPLPDPRSPWQPAGVHGASRLVDVSAFPWTDGQWQPPPLASAVCYELHVGTFTPAGTFDAAIDRLDHLVRLGVTHVELMPVAEFAGGRGWGYDGVDLFAPHHAYGGPAGLQRLVDACHARGLAVLLDVVYNHLGPTGNYLARFGPYFTDRYRTPWGDAVNLDAADSDEVRRFVCDNALMWLRDYHVDGLRLDAVHAFLDRSATHVLEQLTAEVRDLETRLGRRLVVIAESDLNDPRLVRPVDRGGYGLDAQWNEDFHHALHAGLTGERHGYYADFGRLADLATALRAGFVYAGQHSAYRRRRHGRSAAGLPGHRFVGCLQNHDQVGNRARGERTSHLISTARLEVGAALVLTAPFVPMLFQGEEWGATTPFLYFTDHADPALGQAVREGRQREFAAFGWDPADIPDPQSADTFVRSKLDWREVDREPHARLLAWHRRLIALRRGSPDLADGRMDRVGVRVDEDARWLVVERGAVTVVVNLGAADALVPLPPERARRVLLTSNTDIRVGTAHVTVPPDAVVLLGP
jgi:maltooligosyltrehalose trehalohydrolase